MRLDLRDHLVRFLRRTMRGSASNEAVEWRKMAEELELDGCTAWAARCRERADLLERRRD